MIDLTQGEGNKRVRKRNKKPTKGQLAAQAAADAYRASARLPGQGDGPRPAPYPTPQIAKEGRGDDDYRAPPMQTNFTTVVNSPLPEEQQQQQQQQHHSSHSSSSTTSTTQQRQHSQPPRMSISSRQLHGHQNAAQPLPFSPSPDALGLDPTIDPTLRPILSKDGLSHHTVGRPVTTASHYDILFSRGQSVSGAPQIQQQASAGRQQAQVTLPPPPSHPTYHHQLSTHQGEGPHASTSRAISTLSHIPQLPQHSHSFLQQQLQSDAPRQMQRTASPQQPIAPAQTQLQPTRLPPMRTLSESPAPTTPSLRQQPTPPSLSTTQRQQQQQQQQQHPTMPTTTTSGFARFATAHSGADGFGKPTFGKSARGGNPPNLMPMIRPLVLSEDKGQRRATESEGCGESSGHDKREREGQGIGGSRRNFIPPSPRPGVEYVQRADGGIVTARWTTGRHEECSVDWLNRLDPGDGSGTPPPQEDAT